jgi:curved DNA-binding protein CbpA
MKLEEAAAILGVSVDADLELLKQTYRKLALAWHPDKVCADIMQTNNTILHCCP